MPVRLQSAAMTTEEFQARVLDWYAHHGRSQLPWQTDRTPYHVWISEIMLQQTQVATVIPYYRKFMARFPDVATLAQAPLDAVIEYWAGLGYYARARNLHRAAIQLQLGHDGRFPVDSKALQSLPGIGRSTAGAILSLGMNQRAAILDGNVKRVLCRFAGIEGWPGETSVNRRLWALSESLTPVERVADYNQAMMDLGALTCTRNHPDCDRCPLAPVCAARRHGQTSILPTPRPRRAMPIRACYLLLLRNPDGLIFLETRPPAGIWGGLRSLPEFDSLADLDAWCLQRGIDTGQLRRLPERRHTFSHYHLDFTPVLAAARACPGVSETGASGWFHPARTGGLPAPIKALLADPATLNINHHRGSTHDPYRPLPEKRQDR